MRQIKEQHSGNIHTYIHTYIHTQGYNDIPWPNPQIWWDEPFIQGKDAFCSQGLREKNIHSCYQTFETRPAQTHRDEAIKCALVYPPLWILLYQHSLIHHAALGQWEGSMMIATPIPHRTRLYDTIATPIPHRTRLYDTIATPIPHRTRLYDTIATPIPHRTRLYDTIATPIPHRTRLYDTIATPIPHRTTWTHTFTTSIGFVAAVPSKPAKKLELQKGNTLWCFFLVQCPTRPWFPQCPGPVQCPTRPWFPLCPVTYKALVSVSYKALKPLLTWNEWPCCLHTDCGPRWLSWKSRKKAVTHQPTLQLFA